jgi:hypothetical protein
MYIVGGVEMQLGAVKEISSMVVHFLWGRVTTVRFSAVLFRLSGPVGPSEENWPNCTVFRDFD